MSFHHAQFGDYAVSHTTMFSLVRVVEFHGSLTCSCKWRVDHHERRFGFYHKLPCDDVPFASLVIEFAKRDSSQLNYDHN